MTWDESDYKIKIDTKKSPRQFYQPKNWQKFTLSTNRVQIENYRFANDQSEKQ